MLDSPREKVRIDGQGFCALYDRAQLCDTLSMAVSRRLKPAAQSSCRIAHGRFGLFEKGRRNMMQNRRGMLIAIALLASAHLAGTSVSAQDYTPHVEYQAVDENGFGVFPLNEPIYMKGVIINHPDDMLDPTPGAPNFLGGLWQEFIQTADPEDFGGTALWMGQYIGKIRGKHPEDSYTDEEWRAEMRRLNFDPQTGHPFRPGDLVKVYARAPGLHFRGKTNINEQHCKDPSMDFDIHLLEAGFGLPAPELITLSDVKDERDEFIFDHQRLIGVEHYQGTLVRFNDVDFISRENWKPDGELVIEDGTGRTFPVKLGRNECFEIFDPPPGRFDIIGIFDQEDLDPDNGLMDGYRLWVMKYDGNGHVIGAEVNCDVVKKLKVKCNNGKLKAVVTPSERH